MSKSQQSWNKKEREKQKQRERRLKEERKLGRKESAKKGKSLEEMMAYIDEDGNLSSTPPDPQKKREIKLEDIEIGVPKLRPADQAHFVRTGTVTFFNESKGYGFITDQENQQRVFVHVNSCNEPIKEQSKVRFEIQRGPKGANAVNVSLVS
jgi:cold shock CspA family protein